MTFTIVARDDKTGAFGVCGFTGIVGYGFMVPQASLRGAAATQAFVNTNLALAVMQLADSGIDAADAAQGIIEADHDRTKRQLLAIGTRGEPYGWSGQDALPWCGQKVGPGYIAGGNDLSSPSVVVAMSDSYIANQDLEFGLRLIRAVQAGKQAGGERPEFNEVGVACSAALLIAAPKPEFWHNLRIDASEGDASVDLEQLREKAIAEGELMARLYQRTSVVIRPLHWRWVRDLTGQKDPPD